MPIKSDFAWKFWAYYSAYWNTVLCCHMLLCYMHHTCTCIMPENYAGTICLGLISLCHAEGIVTHLTLPSLTLTHSCITVSVWITQCFECKVMCSLHPTAYCRYILQLSLLPSSPLPPYPWPVGKFLRKSQNNLTLPLSLLPPSSLLPWLSIYLKVTNSCGY